MGSYAESLLTTGESVVMRQRQHWLALILDSRLAIVFWLAALVLGVFWFFIYRNDNLDLVVNTLFLVALAAGIVVVAWRWWHWRSTEYLVTSRRLLNVSGIINKRSLDSSLEKINDAILEVNVIGRILDYGDLKILTAAERGIDRYRMLHHATAFKKAMLTAKHELEVGLGSGADGLGRGGSTAIGGATTGSSGSPPAANVGTRADTPEEVTAALVELAKLRDAGHLSAAEYEAKKQELLGRL